MRHADRRKNWPPNLSAAIQFRLMNCGRILPHTGRHGRGSGRRRVANLVVSRRGGIGESGIHRIGILLGVADRERSLGRILARDAFPVPAVLPVYLLQFIRQQLSLGLTGRGILDTDERMTNGAEGGEDSG